MSEIRTTVSSMPVGNATQARSIAQPVVLGGYVCIVSTAPPPCLDIGLSPFAHRLTNLSPESWGSQSAAQRMRIGF
ncbi:hypothetical protein LLH03_20485 [bacterium]|nr:hypothetical protein [bacterium]